MDFPEFFSGFSRTFLGFFLGLKNSFFTIFFYDENINILRNFRDFFYEKMGREFGNRLYSITGTPHTHGLTTPSTLKYPKMGG